MNPQGQNNQAPGDHPAPAGPWNAGADLHNAPPPLVLPAAQPAPPSWREQCKDEGWAAGDETLQSFLPQPLVADDGSFNWALIDDMSNKKGAPKGLRMALITLAFLIDRRNIALDTMQRLRRRANELSKQLKEAKTKGLRVHIEGAPVDVLKRIRADYQVMRTRLVAMRAELQALEDEAQDYQRELREGQRHLLAMFHGDVPFAPLVDVNAYTERGHVEVLPPPPMPDVAMVPGERLMSHYPASALVFMMCLMGTPLILLHPSSQNTAERPAQWDRTAVMTATNCALFLLFAHLMDMLFLGRRRF